MRVILDSHLRLPLDSTIVRTCGTYRTIVYATTGPNAEPRRQLEQAGVEVHEVAANEQGQVPVRSVVDNLTDLGFRTVFVEGGSKVITSFLRAGLVDRMVVVIAPVIIGRGVEAVGDLEITSLDRALRPRRSRTRRLGQDRVWALYFDEP